MPFSGVCSSIPKLLGRCNTNLDAMKVQLFHSMLSRLTGVLGSSIYQDTLPTILQVDTRCWSIDIDGKILLSRVCRRRRDIANVSGSTQRVCKVTTLFDVLWQIAS
jgi:hypothetical protein